MASAFSLGQELGDVVLKWIFEDRGIRTFEVSHSKSRHVLEELGVHNNREKREINAFLVYTPHSGK